MSYLLVCNKLPHIYQVKTTHIYYLTGFMGQESGHALAFSSS